MSFSRKLSILSVFLFFTAQFSFSMNKFSKLKLNKFATIYNSKFSRSITGSFGILSCIHTQKYPQFTTSIAGYSTQKKLPAISRYTNTLTKRPEYIQNAIDKAFEDNKPAAPGEWLHGGRCDHYTLLVLDEDELLKNLASPEHPDKDIYILDVGCAEGGWGKNAAKILQRKECKKSGKKFHIFSVTGGKECEEVIKRSGNVKLHQFNHFKIENLDEEFLKRGFNLKNKCNLIVSDWAVRHCVDTFGMLERMYGLLSPKQGALLCNGFLFKYDDSPNVQGFPIKNEDILTHTNATVLFRHYDSGWDKGQFMLVRNNKKRLNIPLEYHSVDKLDCNIRWQCMSGMVTTYKKIITDQKPFEREIIEEPAHGRCQNNLYYDKGNNKSKQLYDFLKSKKFFYKTIEQEIEEENSKK